MNGRCCGVRCGCLVAFAVCSVRAEGCCLNLLSLLSLLRAKGRCYLSIVFNEGCDALVEVLEGLVPGGVGGFAFVDGAAFVVGSDEG